jgi:acyl-CoA oxidase
MPGIKCGDMGPKLGYGSKDNGWLTFDNVKIPRDNLL